jgi:hypothetical protein
MLYSVVDGYQLAATICRLEKFAMGGSSDMDRERWRATLIS